MATCSSAHGLELLDVNSCEVIRRLGLADGRVHLDLAHVRVAPVLVVRQHGHLHHVGAHRALVQVAQRHRHPARRLAHLDLLHLSQVVEVIADAH